MPPPPWTIFWLLIYAHLHCQENAFLRIDRTVVWCSDRRLPSLGPHHLQKNILIKPNSHSQCELTRKSRYSLACSFLRKKKRNEIVFFGILWIFCSAVIHHFGPFSVSVSVQHEFAFVVSIWHRIVCVCVRKENECGRTRKCACMYFVLYSFSDVRGEQKTDSLFHWNVCI